MSNTPRFPFDFLIQHEGSFSARSRSGEGGLCRDEEVPKRGGRQVRQLKQMAEENPRLNRIVADLTFDNGMLQDVLRKKFRALAGSFCRGACERELPGRRAESLPGRAIEPWDGSL
jgi:hypothetical protein